MKTDTMNIITVHQTAQHKDKNIKKQMHAENNYSTK